MTEEEALCFAIDLIEEIIDDCATDEGDVDLRAESIECVKTLTVMVEEGTV
jgi:hypothetical protein